MENSNSNKSGKRSSLKLASEDKKSQKTVVWDNEKLEEQELDKKLHPKIKITEPKTPYSGNVTNLFK